MDLTAFLRCLIIYLVVQPIEALPNVIRIGGLFDEADIRTEVAFRYAINRVNTPPIAYSSTRFPFRLEPMIDNIPARDSFHASKRVCHLLRSGVAAIFGPQNRKTSDHIQSICDAMEVPHIEIRSDPKVTRHDYSLNLHPHPSSLGQAYVDLVRLFGWKSFAILYENNEGLVRLQNLLKQEKGKFKISVRQLPSGLDYRSVLRQIKRLGETNFILDCDTSIIGEVLKQAQQIGMMTPENSYIIASLDLDVVDLEDFKYGGSNITSVRLTDPQDPNIRHIFNEIRNDITRFDKSFLINEIQLGSETALMYDAVYLFVLAIQALDNSTDVRVAPIACDGTESWAHGYSLTNYMKLVNMTGLTGIIEFDSLGLRTDFRLDIVSLTLNGLEKVGTWSKKTRANYTLSNREDSAAVTDGIRNKTLLVSFAFNDPYIMLKESTKQLTGNERYEGFCIDLLNEVADMLSFDIILLPVPNNSYGSKDSKTGEWNGMIKELLEKRADMAITDMTINSERAEAVDFTMPFMNLGIALLYKKPRPSPPSLFSFMSPLSIEVWIYMMSALVGVSVLLYVLARFSPYEWQNPHPCDSNPEVLENQFNINNCMWFAIGSLMQQGCDFLPQATSTRMVAGMWWFFTLIMISSYTANLAAFLTIEQLESPIESVEDLAKQTKIKYGCTATGATRAFFRDSTVPMYRRMYAFMQSQSITPYVSSNAEGYERVQNSDYALLAESTSIEYATERKCDLSQVGGLLDSKSYGIALQTGSPYKAALDVAILNLQERGRLHILKEKWWKQKRGGGKCKEEEGGGSGASELNLDNVGGVFVVLLIGMGLALFVALCEFLGECNKVAKEDGVPFMEILEEELRFVFKCKGSVKPIRGKKQEPPPRVRPSVDIYPRDMYNYSNNKLIYNT